MAASKESTADIRFTLGADIGGTFTDIVLLRSDGRLFSKKVLSTSDDYSRGIQEGVDALLKKLMCRLTR